MEHREKIVKCRSKCSEEIGKFDKFEESLIALAKSRITKNERDKVLIDQNHVHLNYKIRKTRETSVRI